MKPDYERECIQLYCGDCLEILPKLGEVDAVVTDPPYGVNHNKQSAIRRYKIIDTIQNDLIPPNISWISKYKSIVWGGNNFCDQLPRSTGWLIWNKYNPPTCQHSQAEIAWTNCVKTIRLFSMQFSGFNRQRVLMDSITPHKSR